MSLCILKTRELSWQDHSINIEVIMAPRKTDLLAKQHRSLGSKCEEQVNRYELKQNSFLKHLQLEKRQIGQKATDLYVLKTKRFLQNFPVDLRQEMLNKRSFSIALNKIRDEVLENQRRVKSDAHILETNTLQSRKSETIQAIFPRLSSASPKTENTAKTNAAFYVTELKERHSELPPVVVETNQTRPNKTSLRKRETEHVAGSRSREGSEKSPRQRVSRQRSVRFENDADPESNKESLQKKVRGFIEEQEYFNSQVHHLQRGYQNLYDGVDNGDNKRKLINAFDSFCKSEDKISHLDKLAKLASKCRVSRSMTNSIGHFKSSRSYQEIHSVS